MEERDLKQAKRVFNSLCEMLDKYGWKYTKDEENLSINCGATGDDLPMDINIKVNTKLEIISLVSPMPFPVPKERRVDMAVAVSLANSYIIDGSFDYNFLNGRLCFRMTSSYKNSLIGEELFKYMLYCSCYTVDDYNDKFFFVANKELSLQEILELFK